MSQDLGYELRVALKLAIEQGRVMSEAFQQGTQNSVKSDGTAVTETDLAISRNVVEAYRQRGIGVVSEEGGSAHYGDHDVMMVDPIDGTNDFIKGQRRVPRTSAAMFSLAYVEDAPVMGVVHAPLLQSPRLYGAIKDGPAIRYGLGRERPKALRTTPETSGIVLVSSRTDRAPMIRERLADMGLTPLQFSCSVFKATAIADPELLYAYRGQAQGREPVVGFVSTSAQPHDYAAAAVIVESAGGLATSLTGDPLGLQADSRGCIMSANQTTHEKLLEAAK